MHQISLTGPTTVPNGNNNFQQQQKINSRPNHFHRHGERGKYTDTMCKNSENFRRFETYKQKQATYAQLRELRTAEAEFVIAYLQGAW